MQTSKVKAYQKCMRISKKIPKHLSKVYYSNYYLVSEWSNQVDDQRSKQEDDGHDPRSEHGTHLLDLRWVANSYERFNGYTDNVPANGNYIIYKTII